MFRIGILNKNEETNISLIQSILNLINPEYIYKSKDDKISLGTSLLNELRNYWQTNYKDKNNSFNIIEGEKALLSLLKGKLK